MRSYSEWGLQNGERGEGRGKRGEVSGERGERSGERGAEGGKRGTGSGKLEIRAGNAKFPSYPRGRLAPLPSPTAFARGFAAFARPELEFRRFAEWAVARSTRYVLASSGGKCAFAIESLMRL